MPELSPDQEIDAKREYGTTLYQTLTHREKHADVFLSDDKIREIETIIMQAGVKQLGEKAEKFYSHYVAWKADPVANDLVDGHELIDRIFDTGLNALTTGVVELQGTDKELFEKYLKRKVNKYLKGWLTGLLVAVDAIADHVIEELSANESNGKDSQLTETRRIAATKSQEAARKWMSSLQGANRVENTDIDLIEQLAQGSFALLYPSLRGKKWEEMHAELPRILRLDLGKARKNLTPHSLVQKSSLFH